MINNSSEFISHDGTKIFCQEWIPEPGNNVIGLLFLIHGYAEHSSRYSHVAGFFTGRGFHVAALDHRGHGKSQGKDTFFKSIDHCVGDVDMFVEQVRQSRPGLPVFVLGHSMGGLITAKWAEDRQPKVNGILLTGPLLMVDENLSPVMVKLAGLLGFLTPRMKTIKLDNSVISRDAEVRRKYDSDPLNYRGGIPAATGAAMNRAIREVHENAENFRLPVRIMHGTGDQLASIRGSQELIEEISSEDRILVPYEGLYHEILNEPEKDQVMADSLEWMMKHISG